MTINEFEYSITSVPDKECCVCEIQYKGYFFAELFLKDDKVMAYVFGLPDANQAIALDALVEALSCGRDKLLEKYYP